MLATGNFRLGLRTRGRTQTSGFTLIELLVVMVIIGITVALIAPNFLPDDATRIRRETQRMGLSLEYAYQFAESTGRPVAWLPSQNGAEFQELDDVGHWQKVTDDPQLPQTQLPPDMLWGDHSRIIFVPGEAAPEYQIQLSLRNAVVLLNGDALGKVSQSKTNGGATK